MLKRIVNAIKKLFGFGELPPGYYLETTGTSWRFVDETGYKSINEHMFKSTAVRWAWVFYRYSLKQKRKKWKKVE